MSEPNDAGRRRDSPLFFLALNRDARRPLHRQIYDGLRSAILDGRFAPGSRLPSTRDMADDLGVARNTVVQAYVQLRVEGYVVTRRGGGTRVRRTLPEELLTVRSPDDAGRSSRERTAGHPLSRGEKRRERPTEASLTVAGLSGRGRTLVVTGAGFLRSAGTAPVPFQMGVPALDLFPAARWGRIAGRRWRRGQVVLGDADPAGEPELRSAIATHVARARGARCGPEQVIVVNGAQQGIHLIAQVLLDPGDAVWMEDPGYMGARSAFTAAGGELVPVPVDTEGLDVDAGERDAPDARLAYVTPSHQLPLGSVLSASRRLRLLAWARRVGAWIIEDDYDSEFRYEERPLHSLQGLDAEQRGPGEATRVFYVGTLSKSLAPGLRLGYVVVPPAFADAFRAARAAIDRHTPTDSQGVLAEFMEEGHYTRHLRRIREVYAERQRVLIRAAESEIGGVLTLSPHPAGLHVVGWLPSGVDDERVARAAGSRGLRVSPLSRYTMSARSLDRPGLVLGYGGFGEDQIREGVVRLGMAIEECR